MKTKVLNKNDVKRQWYIVDAKDRILGRFATRIARILIGKHKPDYSPHVDCGDYVIVLNAGQFKVTGKKLTDKIYYHHTTYPGGLKARNLQSMLEKNPRMAIYNAVSGMLPKNRLRKLRLRRLKIYLTAEHPHGVQKPETIVV